MGIQSAPVLPTGWRAIFRGVRGRLFGSYGALVFVLLAGLIASYSSTQVLRDHFTHTVNTVDALTTTIARTVKLRDDQETGLRGYLLTDDPVFLQPYTAAARALPPLQRHADTLLRDDAHGKLLLDTMRKDADAWQTWAAPYVQQPLGQAPQSPTFVTSMLQGKSLFDRFRQSSERLTTYLDTGRAQDLQVSLHADQQSGGIFFWVLVLTIGVVLIVGWLTARGITRPLDQLSRAVAVIGHGELDQPIAVSGVAEFVRLGAHMDQMRRQLYTQRTLTEIVGSSLHLDTIWSRFAAEARGLVPFDRMSLSAVESDGLTLNTLYAEGVGSDRSGGGTKRAITTTATSLVQPSQRCLLLQDLTALPPEQHFIDVQGGIKEGLRAKAILPVRAKGQTIGYLNLGSRQIGAFTEELLGPILALAPLVGAAMENARLYASLDEANVALENANRELEAFAYSVSHDLRAPLRSIAGFSQAILEDYADRLDEDGADYLQQVIGASTDMAQLIDDLLRLSRLTRAELQREPTDVGDQARDVIADLAMSTPERTVSCAIEEGVIAGADPRLLRIVLENLLGNAWKFTRTTQDARIEVGVSISDGQRAYYVRDNGVGFDMAYAGKLFGAFQRLHTTQEFEGTGIGLATVQRIIHRHGGRIWAESALGQGATFYFTLESAEEKPCETTP